MARPHRDVGVPGWIYLPAVAGAVFVLLPLVAMVVRVEWGSFVELITSEDARDALALSLRTSSISTLTCIVLGVPMAVASDANPGSAPGASLLLAMNMARRLFGLTSEEVLLGTTRHAARALALDAERGSLTPGRTADFAVWSIDTLDELGYWAGFNPCSMVVRRGEIVLERAV